MSNELEKWEFKLEKNIGIQKQTGKARKFYFFQATAALTWVCLVFSAR